MIQPIEKDTLAIVTGANGAVGRAYLQELACMPTVRSTGIVRSESNEQIPNVEYFNGIDLLQATDVNRVIQSIFRHEAARVLLIHPVGKFKFEEEPEVDVDPEILLSNTATFGNTIRPILEQINEDASLVMCGFGSVSDKYDVPFWRSYTAAKNELRESLRRLSETLMPKGIQARSVMVNVSTTDTGNENALRPNADKRYWLKPEKIARQSLPVLLSSSDSDYQELDIIEERPDFEPGEYYSDPQSVLKKWKREMGNS